MESYPKMLNLFKFDEATGNRRREYSCVEFTFLQECPWVLMEKVDGMNVRIIFDEDGSHVVKGRTDRAVLHPDLVAAIDTMVAGCGLASITLYGEGYGGGIQKGGVYRPDKSFILFDAWREVSGYLPFSELHDLAVGKGIPLVPVIGTATLRSAYERVQRGMQSTLRIDGGFAEGLVGRPLIPLRGIHGQRLMVKVKHRDYYDRDLIE